MYAIRSYYAVKPAYSAAYYALAQSLQKLDRIDECRMVTITGIEVSTKNGDAMVTKNLDRITSYNVCYTKLLRMTSSMCLRPKE